ncbi:hypothetical protein [Yinghuangia seranimata]|uniref:hypothetical protein n=1 Tax=Yinghuangia seranimata TaxID=408067 RepID=UPI00248B1DDE|nr:hypothetical protein [Yinghuangia seranimata]MDI2128551.1 hypothetical protein [Yinghuangia seranimata]
MKSPLRRGLVGAAVSLAATAGLVAGTAGTANADTLPVKVYSVRLTGLMVVDNQDNNSVDEVYIKVDGRTVWGPWDMHRGNPVDLSMQLPVYYTDSVGTPLSIEAFDRDPGRDDRVGGFVVGGYYTPLGPQTRVLSGNGGVYEVYLTVTQIA